MSGTVYIPPFDEMLQASASLGLRSKAPPLWRGCVGYWPLSEGGGGTAFDLARGNHGTHAGDPTHVVGRYGRCLDFDGTDDYIQAADNNILDPPTNNITCIAWVNRESESSYAGIVEKGKGNSSDGWLMRTWNDGTVEFEIRHNSNQYGPHTTTSITNGAWLHLVGTYDGNAVRIYANGEEEDSVAYTGVIGTNTHPLVIAYDKYHVSRRFNGLISNATIWNRALPKSQIQQLYEDPHVMTTLRRPVTTVVMGGGGPAPSGFYARRYYDNLLAGGV